MISSLNLTDVLPFKLIWEALFIVYSLKYLAKEEQHYMKECCAWVHPETDWLKTPSLPALPAPV